MAAITFPPNPQIGDTYTAAGATWMWDGTAWVNANVQGGFLPLTGGVVTGDLTVTGDATLPNIMGPSAFTGNLTMYGWPTAILKINGSLGSPGAPSPVTSGTLLGQFTASGWNGSGYPAAPAGINITAAENWNASANGTQLALFTTPTGQSAAVAAITLGNNIITNLPVQMNQAMTGVGITLSAGLYAGTTVTAVGQDANGNSLIASGGLYGGTWMQTPIVYLYDRSFYITVVNSGAVRQIVYTAGASVDFNLGNLRHEWFTGSAWVMFLANNGDLGITGTLSQGSDRRLKRNIERAPYGLKEIAALEAKTYIRVNAPDGAAKQIGLIAQDVETQMPEAVTQNEGTLGLDYSALVAVLVNAVNELSAKVSALSPA